MHQCPNLFAKNWILRDESEQQRIEINFLKKIVKKYGNRQD